MVDVVKSVNEVAFRVNTADAANYNYKLKRSVLCG